MGKGMNWGRAGKRDRDARAVRQRPVGFDPGYPALNDDGSPVRRPVTLTKAELRAQAKAAVDEFRKERRP